MVSSVGVCMYVLRSFDRIFPESFSSSEAQSHTCSMGCVSCSWCWVLLPWHGSLSGTPSVLQTVAVAVACQREEGGNTVCTDICMSGQSSMLF